MKFISHWRKWLSALLVAALLTGTCGALAEPAAQIAAAVPDESQLTREDIEALGAKIYTHDGRVTFVEGACTAEPVRSMDDAAALVDAMVTLLGGDERTQFEPWRTLEDTAGNRYYVFQQMYAETTVPGGAVKVVTDAEGGMLGLVGCVEAELPDLEEAVGITPKQAEALAIQHMIDANQPQANLLDDFTEKIILPVNLDIDPDLEEDKQEGRFVWAVYTDNPDASVGKGVDLPYLAHYITMDGEYLYNLPTVMPGDDVGAAGYNAAYAFEFMEPADYTTTLKLSNGKEKEITVTLMRDTRTGMYYMGNIERRIAVAECYDFLYDKGRVRLVASSDNTGWDDTCLLSLYNYCRVWDYYHEIGWMGGDGEGTPMLILKDFCDKDRDPVDNAAYAGRYYGWQVFLSSAANDLAQCLDVLAHEFTHCVTHSVMTYNAYMNDYGAINEAVSDIQGNLCEMMMGDTEDTTWAMGENSANPPIRSMSAPQDYGQPDYTWDLCYVPNVKSPTTLNDRGGVHSNSSLLNNVAYRLCTDGGMTLEEARAFWFAVDCAMVPGTDYAQLSELMPWVMGNLGLERYTVALDRAMDATRLRSNEIPTAMDDDRAMVTLTLPDKDTFEDGHWALGILSVNFKGIMQRIGDIFERREGYENALDDLVALAGFDPALLPTQAELEENGEGAWSRFVEAVMDRLLNGDAQNADALTDEQKKEMVLKFKDWYKAYLDDLVFAGMGAAGQDGRTVRMVCRPGTTVPVLFRMEIDNDMKVKSLGLAVYGLGAWHDLTVAVEPIATLVKEALQTGKPVEAEDPDLSWLDDLFGTGALFGDGEETPGKDVDGEKLLKSLGMFAGGSWLYDMLFFKIAPGAITPIPETGLDEVSILDGDTIERLFGELDLQKLMESVDQLGKETKEAKEADAVDGETN